MSIFESIIYCLTIGLILAAKFFKKEPKAYIREYMIAIFSGIVLLFLDAYNKNINGTGGWWENPICEKMAITILKS